MAFGARENTELSFREVGEGDRDALARFLEENDVPAITQTFTPFPLTAETAEKIACAPRQDRYYAVVLDERILGLSMLRGWDEGYEVPSFGIMVDYRYHNQGVGARLMDYTLEEARRLGSPRVRLTVYERNAAGVHLYRSRGFTESSRESVTVSGSPEVKIVMHKELREPGSTL